jgi:hypothetical protein
MDYAVKEIAPQVWRVDMGGTVRIIRYRPDSKTFAPWDICSADGQRLWGAPSLESAFRWIQARTGHPAEALLAEGLLEQTASNKAFNPDAAAPIGESADPATAASIPTARK